MYLVSRKRFLRFLFPINFIIQLKFDREIYQVKMGQGWAVTVPLIIGPDDQVSYLQQALSQRGTGADPTILAEFNKIEQIIVDSDQEFKLLLTVNGKKDQLTLTCSDQIELDNLADLIDGYCRGARSDMVSF